MLSSATTSSEDDTAKHVEVAGLVMQLFFVFTFVGICLYVWTQVKAHAPAILKEVTPSFWCLFVLIGLLVMRNALPHSRVSPQAPSLPAICSRTRRGTSYGTPHS